MDLTRRHASLPLLPVLLTLISGHLRAQCTLDVIKAICASDGVEDDRFGEDVALHGNVAVVSAISDDADGIYSGSVYVYRFDGTGWNEEQKLIPSDGEPDDQFGYSVSVHENTIAVGVVHGQGAVSHSGSAFIFRFSGSIWIEEQQLTASDAEMNDRFGSSVAVEGDMALVGAEHGDGAAPSSGVAYAYRFDGNSWIETQKIAPSVAATWDGYGSEISMNGGVALVSSIGSGDNGSNSGAVYLYRFDGVSWNEAEKLLAGDGESNDWFGWSVSLHGEVAAIGAGHADGQQDDSGAVYVFRDTGSTWIQEAKLIASDGSTHDRLGRSVSVSQGLILAGAIGCDSPAQPGAAYAFRFDGTSWREMLKLRASDSDACDSFGWSLSLDGNQALLGAFNAEGRVMNSGAGYVVPLPGIALDATQDDAAPGQMLGMEVCGGLPDSLAMLFLASANAVPVSTRIAMGFFDSQGRWLLAGTVPNVHAFTAEFQALGFNSLNGIGISNLVTVEFL